MSVIAGIGYILALIPILNLAAPFLIGAGWFMTGSRTGQTLFRVTGILMITTFLIAVGLLALTLGSLFSIIFTLPLGADLDMLSEEVIANLGSQLFGFAAVLAIGGIAVSVLGLVTVISELVSHFRAAKVLNSAWFRRAAITRIITLILAAVFIVVFVALAITSPFMFMDFTDEILGGTLLLLVLPLVIGGLLANIFSAVAFFTVEK